MTMADASVSLRRTDIEKLAPVREALPHLHSEDALRGLDVGTVDPGRHVVFERIGKTYGAASSPVRALHDISLEIRRGEKFGFIGRSGAGKSTLIRLINRLERPTEGRIYVNGNATLDFDENALVALRRRIGMIFQHFNLMSAKTVAQNVGLPLVMARTPKALIEKKVRALLDLVGLADKYGAYPAQLSGGQKQRVGIARALVHDPDILLCDEATSALDPETTQSILNLLNDINARLGITIVLITHEMAVIRDLCDRVAVLDKGEIVELGEVWRVFGSPQHAVTRSLLGQGGFGQPNDIAQQCFGGDRFAGQMLVKIAFPGEDEAPNLLRLSAALSDVQSVRLLQSDINRIQGRTFGQLVLGLPARSIDQETISSRVRAIAPNAQIEVQEYVADRL